MTVTRHLVHPWGTKPTLRQESIGVDAIVGSAHQGIEAVGEDGGTWASRCQTVSR